MDVEVDMTGEVEVEEFKNLFLTCLPTRRRVRSVRSRTTGRLRLGVAMEGASYQLDYVRLAVNTTTN